MAVSIRGFGVGGRIEFERGRIEFELKVRFDSGEWDVTLRV